MKLILCIVAVLLVIKEIISAPVSNERRPVAEIVEQEYNRFPDGGYTFRYVTSDGQTREETGYFRYIDDEPVLTIKGSYSYFGDDGVQYIVRYRADENGYNVDDKIPIDDINTPAPILALPPNILASLAG